MTDHIQLCQTLWVCSFLPGSCKSLQICGWWQAKRSHGSSGWKIYISHCRSPRVISQESSTLQNYNSPNWCYSNQWKSHHSTALLPPVLAPNGKLKTPNVSLCCSCTNSTAAALWHRVSFLQDETVRLPSSVLLPALTPCQQASYQRKLCVYLQIWLAYALQALCPQLFENTIKCIQFQAWHMTWVRALLQIFAVLLLVFDQKPLLLPYVPQTQDGENCLKFDVGEMRRKNSNSFSAADHLLRKVPTEIIACMIMFFFVKNTARVTWLGFSKQTKPHQDICKDMSVWVCNVSLVSGVSTESNKWIMLAFFSTRPKSERLIIWGAGILWLT